MSCVDQPPPGPRAPAAHTPGEFVCASPETNSDLFDPIFTGLTHSTRLDSRKECKHDLSRMPVKSARANENA